MNATLTGSKDYSSWQNAVSSLAGISQPGNSVQLTINSRIQAAAEQALSGKSGAIVVLDPRTGAVLAKASAPSYTNSDVSALMSGAETGESLFDRTTQALYTPGSTFKVITLAAALDSGAATLDTTYRAPASMEIGGADVVNHLNEDLGTLSLEKAFAYSSNTAFGQVADEVGAEALVNYGRAFGYGSDLGLDFTTTASILPEASDMTEWELAWAGAGRPSARATRPAPRPPSCRTP